MDQEKTFQIVVRVMIRNSSGEVLLVKRCRDSKVEPGKFVVPGGKVEFGEDSFRAAVREIKEELGIEVVPEFEFYKEDWTSVSDKHCIVLYFSTQIEDEEAICLREEENDDYKFFSVKAIRECNEIGFDHKVEARA